MHLQASSSLAGLNSRLEIKDPNSGLNFGIILDDMLVTAYSIKVSCMSPISNTFLFLTIYVEQLHVI